MSRSVFLSLLVFATTLFLACGGAGTADENGSQAATDVEDQITEMVEEQTGMSPSKDTTPCEILDDALLRKHFEVGEAEINRSPGKYSPHPLCTASWEKPNAAELEAQRQDQMSDYLMKKMQGEDVDMPSFRTTDEVSLTINSSAFDSADEARQAFESAMGRLEEGITVSAGEDMDVTVQADMEPVDGIGLDARWVPKYHQLSVVTPDHIFHVGVRVDGGLEAEREKAEAVARDLVGRL